MRVVSTGSLTRARDYEYITEEFAGKTTNKTIIHAYERDKFSICVYGNTYRVHSRGLGMYEYRMIKKEMSRLYPDLMGV